MATAENLPDPDSGLDPALPQKKRARRRLVGAIALCLAALIVFPLLFEQEPHRGTDDVKVQIPSRDTPLPAPGAAGSASGASPGGAAAPGAGAPATGGASAGAGGRGSAPAAGQGSATPPPAGAPAARADGKSEPRGDGKAAPRSDAKADAKADQKTDSKAEQKASPRADARADAKSDRTRRDGKAAASDGKRYLLQVGAFATEKGAADQAAKVRGAGLAVFTEKVRTAQGDRIRVRVGPFPNREQAEAARGQLKLVGIDSALIAP